MADPITSGGPVARQRSSEFIPLPAGNKRELEVGLGPIACLEGAPHDWKASQQARLRVSAVSLGRILVSDCTSRARSSQRLCSSYEACGFYEVKVR